MRVNSRAISAAIWAVFLIWIGLGLLWAYNGAWVLLLSGCGFALIGAVIGYLMRRTEDRL
jgi:hypothetical protein